MLKQKLSSLGELDKTLRALASKAIEDKKTKACLFNLVIAVEKQERLAYYLKVIQELIDHFPCRIFLIHFDDTQTSPLVNVSLLSPKSAPNLVCDFIEVDLPVNQWNLLFSLLEANYVNDLPIFYMPTEHSDKLSEFTMRIAKSVRRVICDSTDVLDIELFRNNILKLTQLGIDVSDLNWSRIESWREVIARNLNDTLLKNLKQIEIVYNNKNSNSKQYPFQAIFLKGFLINRLHQFGMSNVSVTTKVATESHIWQGAILEVSFFDDHGTKQVFSRNLEKPEEAIIHFESKFECYMPQYVQFTKTESGQSLIKEIRHASVSKDYQAIIQQLKSYL
jgi:Glucose-6-phosphate dehydrogenase subunit